MAVMGAGMGVSFIIALVLGPVISGPMGVPGIFDLTGVLAIVAIPGVLLLVPSAPRLPAVPGGLQRALADSQLMRLDGRSDARRVGQGGVSTGRSRWWPDHKKKNN